MQVVKHQHQRLGLGRVLQKYGDGVEKAEAGCLGLQRRRWLKAGYHAVNLRNAAGDVCGAGPISDRSRSASHSWT